jgi:hypothetical protein
MRSLVGGSPCALLEQPVFDTEGQALGRVGAVATRHGELRRIGIEASDRGRLRFVASGRFTLEGDRVVLTH